MKKSFLSTVSKRERHCGKLGRNLLELLQAWNERAGEAGWRVGKQEIHE
ncbi:hypothetical protein [Paenibacillus elgii]|nr:hypothetical protein [Paenibacillus elgii]